MIFIQAYKDSIIKIALEKIITVFSFDSAFPCVARYSYFFYSHFSQFRIVSFTIFTDFSLSRNQLFSCKFIASFSRGLFGLFLYLFDSPRSHLLTALSVTPKASASCFCVSPLARRAAAICSPVYLASIRFLPARRLCRAVFILS